MKAAILLLCAFVFIAVEAETRRCNDKSCAREKPGKGEINKKITATKFNCTPGTRYPAPDGCNTCFCGGDCTKKWCPKKKTKNVVKREAAGCKPGERYIAADGCNKCKCSKSGVAACTKMKCPRRLSKRALPSGCQPGNTWIEDCNACYCTDEGTPSCTDFTC